MKTIIPILILSILFVSCQQNQSEKKSLAFASIEDEVIPIVRQDMGNPPAPPSPSSPSLQPIENQDVINKKIIKDGRLGLQVKELERTKSRVDTLVKFYEAYYANESFNNSEWETSFNLRIRIPYTNFEKFIHEIEAGDGEIQYKEIEARDVTDQFIDLETRLQNKKNYLIRYNELLSKAQTVKDILEIEEKIRGLEEEIESTTGRLKYLSNLVDFSTLDLTIAKRKDFKYNPASRGNFFEKLKQSLSKGWFGFVDFILFLIKIWPLWIITAIIIYALKKFRINRKKTQ